MKGSEIFSLEQYVRRIEYFCGSNDSMRKKEGESVEVLTICHVPETSFGSNLVKDFVPRF